MLAGIPLRSQVSFLLPEMSNVSKYIDYSVSRVYYPSRVSSGPETPDPV